MGIWVYPYTVTPVQVGRGVFENWGGGEPEWCCNVMVKAPNPLGVHPTSMSYVYKVFQHLDTLWMGICVRSYPYTVTHPTWLIFCGAVSLVESTWCDYVMVEADSHLKLIPSSILHIYKVFKLLDMLSIGIQQQPNTVLRTLIGSDFGVRIYLWSQHDVITSWLRLRVTSNCFLHPH
jgi:hypothetical protein